MNRKIALILILAFTLSFLYGCSTSHGNTGAQQLTEEKKKEIDDAWSAVEGHPMGTWFDPENDQDGIRYYGTYDDYDIIFMQTFLNAFSGKEIAGQAFRCQTSFVIYAYKDGAFLLLEDAYDDGLISADAIKTIADLHREYQNQFVKFDYDW